MTDEERAALADLADVLYALLEERNPDQRLGVWMQTSGYEALNLVRGAAQIFRKARPS